MKGHRWFLLAGAVLLITITAILFNAYQRFAPVDKKEQVTAVEVKEPISRQVMLLAEQIVKDVKPEPTKSALQYAYVASTYYDALKVSDSSGALYASQKTLIMLYPDQKDRIDKAIQELAQKSALTLPVDAQVPAAIQTVITAYANRYKTDKHDLAWNGVIPVGVGKWVKVTTTAPFTPRAGEWQRWNLNQAIAAPAPPAYGGAEDLKQVEQVRQISAARNGDDVNKINLWGGAPGTEAPSGIWQNQIYATIKNDLPLDPLKADAVYAEIQRDAAQTMSDAFMECWKIKYTYWTARPSMRIPGLVTAMKDPPFPSYVSGHSTISKAVADVLSTLVPKHAKEWQAMAAEARDSRIKAGIHFEIDNKVGFDVGTEVARQEVANKQLKALLN